MVSKYILINCEAAVRGYASVMFLCNVLVAQWPPTHDMHHAFNNVEVHAVIYSSCQ